MDDENTTYDIRSVRNIYLFLEMVGGGGGEGRERDHLARNILVSLVRYDRIRR